MNDKIILMIVEGLGIENEIIRNIEKNFFKKDDEKVIVCPFCTSIYELYKILKDDDFETEIPSIIIEIEDDIKKRLSCKKDKKDIEDKISFVKSYRDNISEIYLFFDYDGQAQNEREDISDISIKEMLSHFNNETENGKLYISYPMAEVIKDFGLFNGKTSGTSFSEHHCFCEYIKYGRLLKREYERCHIDAKSNIHYKDLVGKCKNKYSQVKKFDYETWKEVSKHTLCKSGCIFFDEYGCLSSYEEYLMNITQTGIFENQCSKYIEPHGRILTLSAYPFFIVDYFGEKIHKQFIK